MWNLIKMDFYRLFSSKTIKVGALVACLACGVNMLFSFGIVKLMENFGAAASLDGMELLLSQATWGGGVDFAQIILVGTTAFSLFIGCMISANFIGSEQSCGYTKNFAGQLPNRGYMVISKFVVTSLAHVMILVIYTIVSIVCAQLLFTKYIEGYAIGKLFEALGLRVLLHLAINAVIIFICTMTKSHAIAMVVGCIFGIGVTKIVYLLADILLGVMKINFSIGNYMPDGINSRLSSDTLNTLGPKALLISIAFIVVFVGANYYVTQKRDVK